MIKNLKLFSVIFSTIVLLPFNALATSCNGKKVNGGASITNVSQNNDGSEVIIKEDIKDFIKESLYDEENASILSLEDLQEKIDFQTKQILTTDLSNLSNELKNSDATSKELSNQIIIQGLKNRIVDNCGYVDRKLKDPEGRYGSEFQEVTGKVLEINESNIFFNLKKFNLRDILGGITENDASKSSEHEIEDDMGKRVDIFADSEKLRIYKFSTDLNLSLMYANDKKHLISIKDYSLFVVLDKDKAIFLTKGISEYLNKKITKNQQDNTVPIYLNNEPDQALNEHFPAILKERIYDLSDVKNKRNINYYLANIYLPEMIYKNNDQEIKVESSYVMVNENDKNIGELLKIEPEIQNQINFLTLFVKNEQPQITEKMIDDNFRIQKFLLADLESYSYKRNNYYLLGKGNVKVNR